jgi:uncharacterized membrane protein YuzA (DUF378 family)
MDRKPIHLIKHYLLIIAGANLGIFAIFNVNVLNALFGVTPLFERTFYFVIGVAAVMDLITHKINCKLCADRTGKKR